MSATHLLDTSVFSQPTSIEWTVAFD